MTNEEGHITKTYHDGFGNTVLSRRELKPRLLADSTRFIQCTTVGPGQCVMQTVITASHNHLIG